MTRRRASPLRQAEALELADAWVVTGVVSDPRAPGYEIVELNGTRFASLPAAHISENGVSEGVQLDPDQFRNLSQAADTEAASRVAVRLLAARPRCEAEMRRALRDRGHRPVAIEGAVARLVERNLIDDEEYARHFARVRGGRGHGHVRIVADLRARGVERQLAEQAVGEVLESEGVNPIEQAKQLAVKRLDQMAHLPIPTQRRRVLAFLARRGFQGWEVRDMVDHLLGRD